jgi:hypothetical protein
MSAVLHVPIIDLTLNKFGDVNLWIGQGKRYHDVPEYVSKELCHGSAGTPLGTHAGREALGLQDARTAIRT